VLSRAWQIWEYVDWNAAMSRREMMDWPVIGAVSAVVLIGGVVTYEVVAFMQDSAPVKKAAQLASYGSSVERSAYEIPGFATGKPAEWTPSFPLIRLIDPDAMPAPESSAPARQTPAGNPTPKPAAAPALAKPPAEAPKAAAPNDVKAANPASTAPTAPAQQPPRVDLWRVGVTAKASYFNLGGHVDRAGIVDSLATSHLRDALKSHRNFPQLPPEIRNHILTQNINLTKVAPFRGLLGMDDKTLEEEQAVRFERVASNR
jgi:hypothetical protein